MKNARIGRYRIIKLGKYQNILRKRKLQLPGNTGSIHDQTNKNERKSTKSVPQKNKKTYCNQTLQLNSHLSNKYQGSPQIHWILLNKKMRKVLRQMDQMTKKIYFYAQGLNPRDDRDKIL